MADNGELTLEEDEWEEFFEKMLIDEDDVRLNELHLSIGRFKYWWALKFLEILVFEDIARLGEGENEEVIGEAIGVVVDEIEYGDEILEQVDDKILVFDLLDWVVVEEYDVEE